MPNIRPLARLAHAPFLETFQDAPTMFVVSITTTLAGVPTTCTVDGQALDLTFGSVEDEHWIFVGKRNGVDLWQIDLWGLGADMSGRATTRF